MNLASFDIFDTTLIRRCGYADIIFRQLARRLYPDNEILQDAFILWRNCFAEKNAKKKNIFKDVSLSEIYEGIGSEFTEIYSAEQIADYEKTIEAENLVANPKVKEIIKEKRQEGYSIVFISDMYLDSNFLRSILLREQCAADSDKIFVSCEHNARKDTGLLYKKIKKELNPSIWIHYGDNVYSDIRMARKNGIKSIRIDTSFSPIERVMEKNGEWTRKNEFRILIGISRFQRLIHGNSPESVLAADCVAPAFLPYVMYILQKAKLQGIEKLFFLSRDGYILMRAAKAMSGAFKDIELKYLFVSRRSLALPFLTYECDVKDYLSIIDSHSIIHRSVDSLLKQLGTDRLELKTFGINFLYKKINNKESEQDFLEKIFNSSFTPVLRDRAIEAEKILVEYFKQEGLMDGCKCAAVDVGWLGTSRLMINRILRRHGARDLDFFYFGIRTDVLPISYGKYTSYFQRGKLPLETITAFVEQYYSASPYPTTVGYVKTNVGKIIPIFPHGQDYKNTDIVKMNVQVIEQFAENLQVFQIDDETLFFFWATQSLRSLLDGRVSIDFKPLLQCSDFDSIPFVKKLSLKELLQVFLLGKSITAFDYGSICISLPKFLCPFIFKVQRGVFQIRMKFIRSIKGLVTSII